MSGVESGRAAPLVGGPPGVELHTVVDGLPSGDTGDTVPVVLPITIEEPMVPNAVAGVIAAGGIVVVDAIVPGTVGTLREGGGNAARAGGCGAGTFEPGRTDMNDVAGCADSASGVVPVEVEAATGAADIAGAGENDAVGPVVPTAETEVTGTAAVPGVICPDGVEQVTTVPGVVGSEASGTGASVVSGAPGWVVAENGLGPLSADVTIAPGIDGSPIAVLPMVDICARQVLQPNSRAVAANIKRRMASTF
jgi:hypothetical protein